MSTFMENRPVGADLFCAKDRCADTKKLKVTFRNFANAANKSIRNKNT